MNNTLARLLVSVLVGGCVLFLSGCTTDSVKVSYTACAIELKGSAQAFNSAMAENFKFTSDPCEFEIQEEVGESYIITPQGTIPVESIPVDTDALVKDVFADPDFESTNKEN